MYQTSDEVYMVLRAVNSFLQSPADRLHVFLKDTLRFLNAHFVLYLPGILF